MSAYKSLARRYFYHVENAIGDCLPDEYGKVETASLLFALGYMKRYAREVMADAVDQGADMTGWHCSCCTEDGTEIFRIAAK